MTRNVAPLQRCGKILAGSAYIPPSPQTDADRKHIYGALKPMGYEPRQPLARRLVCRLRGW
jgi:hypothetical protein